MPDFVFTLDGKRAAKLIKLVREQHAQGMVEMAGGPAPLTGRWRASPDGPAIGPDFALESRDQVTLEYPGADGVYRGSQAPPAISFSATAPPQAAILEIAIAGAETVQIPAARLSGHGEHLPPPRIHRVGKADASMVIPVFSERFAQEMPFLDAVTQLLGWIETQRPFNEDRLRGKLGFDAHFWSSDPVSGLFGTDDGRNHHQQEFYGDLALARRLLSPWLGNSVSLILINSKLRGGAGGQPGGYSAWASIASAPGEHWEAIGLHEVGHAFGLADEYLYEERAHEWPAQFEPNVTDESRPSGTTWQDRVTVGDDPAPTGGLNSAAAPDVVGTFQGARYRTDLYRPSATCLMRQTGAAFCKICTDHIRAQLGG
jgi:IgA Peptidase M64